MAEDDGANAAEPKRPVGRPPKFSPDEARQRLIDAAVAVLLDTGVSPGLDAVRLDAAIAAAGVPRGAAYRIWEHEDRTPQDEFRRAVLMHLISETPLGTGIGVSRQAIAAVIDDHQTLLDQGTAGDREWVRQEVVRVGCGANWGNIRDSQLWRLYRSVAVAATTGAHDDELLTAVRTSEEQMLDAYTSLFSAMAELFGYRLRPTYEMSDFTVCAYALVEGLSNRASRLGQLESFDRPTGRDGEAQSWTLFAIAVERLIGEFFEQLPAEG